MNFLQYSFADLCHGFLPGSILAVVDHFTLEYADEIFWYDLVVNQSIRVPASFNHLEQGTADQICAMRWIIAYLRAAPLQGTP